MKIGNVRKAAAVLAVFSGIGILEGCGVAQESQETEVVEDAAEYPSDADAMEEGIEEADEQEDVENGADYAESVTGRKLTEEELAVYTEWIQDVSNYGFLLSEWENPEQINLFEVFYSGAGISHEGTEEQKQAFLDRYEQEEIYTDFWAIEKEEMNDFLLEKVGLTYDELAAKGNESIEELYYSETGCFCLEAGDTNYQRFACTDGVWNEEGTVVTLYCEGDEWIKKCEVQVSIYDGEPRSFLSNHIIEGDAIDAGIASDSEPVENMDCLIDESVFDNLQTDADASAVENSYVLGDWSKITKEALQGIWYYHPNDVGDDKTYDVVLQFDGEDAIVYYPAVDFYGEARYEWDVVDRSERGLCPELAIYFRGTKDAPLAWYILGIADAGDYFWCNGEVFYKQ